MRSYRISSHVGRHDHKQVVWFTRQPFRTKAMALGAQRMRTGRHKQLESRDPSSTLAVQRVSSCIAPINIGDIHRVIAARNDLERHACIDIRAVQRHPVAAAMCQPLAG